MPRKIKGLRRHRQSWQTYCRVAGHFRSETWPLDTPQSEMTSWLKAQRADQQITPRAGAKSFERDADTYLTQVAALPTFAQRAVHIQLWVDALKGQRRSKITSAQIRGQRDRWLLDGLAPHTVNLRLRALSNLWTVLDGRRAKNPVRDVPEATEPDPEPRSLPYWLAVRIVESVPLRATLERAQARLMITTGLSPVEISRLLPRHWQPSTHTLFVQGRRKGAGGASRTIPLSEAATSAMNAFHAAKGWDKRPSKQFYRCFTVACRRVADDPILIDDTLRQRLRTSDQINAYDLRHTYATRLYLESGDALAASQMLGHRSTVTTQRYVRAAIAERMARAVTAFAVAVQDLDQEVAR